MCIRDRKKLAHAAVGRVVIERPAKDARITIHSARPGVVIGKKGEDIEVLKAELRKILGVQMVHVNIEEIRKPEIDAQVIADSIAQQLEKRIMFRRAMKRAMQNAMRLGAQGIKIASSGRLNGIESTDKSLDPGAIAAAPDVKVPGAGTDAPKGPAVKRVRKATTPAAPAAD